MTVAVVGWGSLLWSPRELAVRGPWRDDGPCLPVEFARRSADRRVTLVVTPGRPAVRTYWAESSWADLERAVTNLAARERCPLERVASLRASRRDRGELDPASRAVAAWLGERERLTAAVWTALPWTFDLGDLERAVVAHLRALDGPALHRAREYVESAPPQVVTPVRLQVERTFGWGRRPLPARAVDRRGA